MTIILFNKKKKKILVSCTAWQTYEILNTNPIVLFFS